MKGIAACARWIVLGLAGSGALLVAGCSDAAPERRPDVVLVTIDTLRPDALGIYGNAREPAPFLASLARRSVVCTRAVSSSSWTAPSTASIFTGVYPDRHGLDRGLFAQQLAPGQNKGTLELHPIGGDLETLPMRLSQAGYRTFGLASNPNIDTPLGFARGFDRFECLRGADASELADVLSSWRSEIDRGPAFVYLHLNDVHGPYEPRAAFLESAGDAPTPYECYQSELSYVDAQLRGLFETFDWSERAIVMVVSDHGEEFGEHGSTGHGFSLHAEVNRVVMFFRSPEPGFVPGRFDVPTSLVDVTPTLVELARVRVASTMGVDGLSLAPLGAGAKAAKFAEVLGMRTLFAQRRDHAGERELWSAHDSAFKWIVLNEDQEPALYDVHADPGEHDNLAQEDPDEAARLGGILRQFRARPKAAAGGAVSVELDAAMLAELKRLGYVDGGPGASH